MADPILRASWLSPLSVRLDIEYGSSGDIEIWMKDSTPQGEAYRKIGSTSSRTFDFSPLNWSTTYWVKVRAISGSTYTGFSNEIELFCACGQVYVGGAPPSPPTATNLSYWQQSADPSGEDIAFSFKDFDHVYQLLAERTTYKDPLAPGVDVAGWLFRYEDGYATPAQNQVAYENEGTFFPAAVRNEGGVIAIYDGVMFDSNYFGGYWFRIWDGKSLYTRILGPDPWEDYYDDENFLELTGNYRSLPYSMEFDGKSRIVTLMAFYDWYQKVNPNVDAFFTVAIRESNDRGRTWKDIEIIAEPVDSEEELCMATMAPDGNGNFIVTTMEWDNQKGQFPYAPYIYAKPHYKIYRYSSPGLGASLIRTIKTILQDEYIWDGFSYIMVGGVQVPYYTKTTFDTRCRSCVVASEGNKIAIAYVYDFTTTGTPPNYTGEAEVRVDVSLDGGNSWFTNKVYVPGETIHWNNEWLTLLPTITISNGSLIMYLCVGSATLDGYRIIKSDTNGSNWKTVFSFPGVTHEIPWVFQLRSDGARVTLTGCKAAVPDNTLALWESDDSGESWNPVSVAFDIPTQVLAGA